MREEKEAPARAFTFRAMGHSEPWVTGIIAASAAQGDLSPWIALCAIIIPYQYQQEIKRLHSRHLISPDMVTTESMSCL